MARRTLARIEYNNALKDPNASENQKLLKEIVSIMEDNFDEDSSTNANFRIWFKALRAINVKDSNVISELEDTLLKLEKWTYEPNASVDAFYYKYIVKFILTFEDGSLDGNADVREELSQMLQELINSSEKIPKRTIPFEWFSGYHRGLRRLIASADLNELDKDEAIKTLHLFRGELPGKESFKTRQAYISLKRLPVYFNPQSICDRITATSENQYVDFGLGFSYSGLRTYHDSIQIHKGKKIQSSVQILSEGMEVTTEVTLCTDSYVITTIRESGGKRCDLQYHQLEPFGYDQNNRPPKQKQFRIKLLKCLTHKKGETVWTADLIIPRKEYTQSRSIEYYPFANIGDFGCNDKDI